MTFFRSSSAAVSSEKNLEQNILLLKDIPAVRSDLPFACLRVGTLLPINALVFTNIASTLKKVIANVCRNNFTFPQEPKAPLKRLFSFLLLPYAAATTR